MPVHSRLTKEDSEKIEELYKRRQIEFPNCLFCGSDKLVLGDYVVEMRPYYDWKTDSPLRTFPYAVVTCLNCGYSHFLNAVVLGVVTPEEAARENINEEGNDGK